MKTHDLIQGSKEWHQHRAEHFNASDAPAMLGCSPYKTRLQLMHELHTGLVPEVDFATQRRFDEGHRIEALARPLAEEIIGEALYPVTGSEGQYSASFDGLTMAEDIDWEHKTLNDELREIMTEGCTGVDLPMQHQVQMEQQLMISGAHKCLFTASKWEGNTLIEARHVWYTENNSIRADLMAGWVQFKKDLEAYTPPAAVPVVIAEPVQALPAVLVQVSGEITVKDNFKAFETALRDFLENRLIREPKTDQDFADLDLQIKAMKGAEEALAGAEAQMLAQVQSIDQAKKTRDMLGKLVRDNRLMAEKMLASEKDRRRGEIVAGGITAFREHIEALNKRLGKPYMPAIQADFGGVIKGMKSMASMENAVATELARAKIEANAVADKIQVNLSTLRELAKDHTFLFADTPTIVLKAPDDLQALVQNRINQHKADEEKRMEAERARIRSEEEARATRLAQEEQDRKAKETISATSSQVLSEKSVADQNARAFVDAIESRQPDLMDTAVMVSPLTPEEAGQAADLIEGILNATPAPVVDTGAMLKLGQICERLGFIISAEFLTGLGFSPAATDKNEKLYRLCDYPAICQALKRHIESTI